MDSVVNVRSLVLAGVATGAAVLGYLAGRRAGQSQSFKSDFGGKSNPLVQYAINHSLREHPCLHKLRQMTLKLWRHRMLAAPEECQLLANIARAMGVRKAIEIGVFTGYNSLSMALALPQDGKLIACDITDTDVNLGRPFWKEAGVEHKIDVRIQPAANTLDELIAAGEAGTYDFVFIDADKSNYDIYYEKSLVLLRPGGLVAVDNVLWSGRVLTAESTWTADTAAIVRLNKKIHEDPRVNISMLTVADGVTLAFKC
ncbi:PREDICTED: catechol O-methyltransferase domain-containing protein 1-like [Branchiostoma belcheri]|uniref:Catechol O-methyltransferase domain-containing protein 1-like n=1 Tax=Branchiostoma belcheri TaxID=7741 RepID=A0A6P4YCB8_BRABE|nr:PREDICTED: catechol O-methyltransferase domain-containing protein 1-like [Branchiostoma belcheri]